jgi:hypothetical protein
MIETAMVGGHAEGLTSKISRKRALIVVGFRWQAYQKRLRKIT